MLMPGRHKPWVMGQIVPRSKISKDPTHKNFEYHLSHSNREYYPPWPKGGCGYTISAQVAAYVADNTEYLIELQGEDVSMGLWLDEAPFQEDTSIINSVRYSTQGNCWDAVEKQGVPVYYSVGHDLPEERVHRCYDALDEIGEVWSLLPALLDKYDRDSVPLNPKSLVKGLYNMKDTVSI
ncbi:hypothetical protein TeGR_g11183 [Tetraparma gracilis]|nr:hypothetical protein TeGR_g11183 [Tetraparma gracilis]